MNSRTATPLTGIGTGVLVGVGERVAVPVGAAVSIGLVGVVPAGAWVGASVGWSGGVACETEVEATIDGRVSVAASGGPSPQAARKVRRTRRRAIRPVFNVEQLCLGTRNLDKSTVGRCRW